MFQAQREDGRGNNSARNNNSGNNSSYLQVDMRRAGGQNNQPSQGTAKQIEEFAVKIFPSYKLKSFTTINVIAVFLVYILCHIWYYTHDINWKCTNHLFGSHYGPDIGQQYQFHRLFTPLYLHQNNMHIFFNVLGLLFFGFELERYYGTGKFVIVYYMAAIGGNLLSVYVHYDTFALGASTSVFGVLALQCIYLIERKEALGNNFRRVAAQFAFILGINFIMSISDDKTDGAAHLGGFIFGGLTGILFLQYDWIQKRRWIKIIVILAMIISSVALTVLILTHKQNKDHGDYRRLPTFSEMENDPPGTVELDGKRVEVTFCSKKLEKWENQTLEKMQAEKTKKDLGGW